MRAPVTTNFDDATSPTSSVTAANRAKHYIRRSRAQTHHDPVLIQKPSRRFAHHPGIMRSRDSENDKFISSIREHRIRRRHRPVDLVVPRPAGRRSAMGHPDVARGSAETAGKVRGGQSPSVISRAARSTISTSARSRPIQHTDLQYPRSRDSVGRRSRKPAVVLPTIRSSHD